jgi:hypothetical protein
MIESCRNYEGKIDYLQRALSDKDITIDDARDNLDKLRGLRADYVKALEAEDRDPERSEPLVRLDNLIKVAKAITFE